MNSVIEPKTLDDVRVVDKHFGDLFADLKKIHESGQRSSSGSIHSVIGASCSGRTFTVNAVVRRIPATRDEEGFTRPVVGVNTPDVGNPKSILLAVLSALGIAASYALDPSQLRRMISVQVREQNVRTLLFDRADRANKRQLLHLADIVEELGLCAILFGGHSLSGILDEDDAPSSVVGETKLIRPYDWMTKEEKEDFTKALARADAEMPSGVLSGFADKDKLMPLRFHQASAGLFARAMKTIKDAARVTYADGKTIVTREDLAAAYRNAFRQADSNNPFLMPDPEAFRPTKSKTSDSNAKDEMSVNDPSRSRGNIVTRLRGRDPVTESAFK